MKAIITKIEFSKEYESKFGTMYNFAISYDDKKAFYTSKQKDQKAFEVGKEAEFTEETKTYQDKQTGEAKSFLTIKTISKFNQQSNYGKALQREQSKYSGFAVSYVKDLIVSGRIDIKEWHEKSKEVFTWMVEMDKSITQ
jgi:hypothetical protein